MYQVISIVVEFWADLFSALNGHLLGMGINLDEIELMLYDGHISLYNYLVLLATLLTVFAVVYVTYKFFVMLYRLVSRLWY